MQDEEECDEPYIIFNIKDINIYFIYKCIEPSFIKRIRSIFDRLGYMFKCMSHCRRRF